MPSYSIEIPLLPAVLPAEADGFEVLGEHLRSELEAAGARLTSDGEDRAQLGLWRSLSGQSLASVAFVPNRPVSIAAARWRRSLDIARTLLEVPRAKRRLARLGYRHVKTLRWHVGRPIDDARKCRFSLRCISTRAYVTGSASESYATVLDRSLELASRAIDRDLRLEKLVPGDSLVAICDRAVLRLSLQPAMRLRLAYAGLKSFELRSPELKRLIPRPLAEGEFGPYFWSLEERMSGSAARAPLSPALTEQAFEALSLLAESAEHTQAPTGLVQEAGLLGTVTERELGLRLEEAMGTLEDTLAPLPRTVGHSDFWAGNLLVENDELRGIVDWDGWNAYELPLMDFLHLHLLYKRSLPWREWGPALLAVLLPFARAGGDERARAYCQKLGIDPSPELLEKLVWAYWIRRAARQVEFYEWRNEKDCLDSAIREVAAVFLDSRARRKPSTGASSSGT
ncbi:MAG: phosphotransferase [Gaiellaceae bacterium]